MRNKTWKIVAISLVVLAVGLLLLSRLKSQASSQESMRKIKAVRGTIQNLVSTTGTVLPKNRLEIKPPVNGRIESVLAQEGDKVKVGQILAWMSSTERAALLDNARGQGEAALKYWEDAYKPIPLLAPIDGEVIVATTQPGQAATTADAVVVLSDHLIIRAQVDETDIAKVKLGQNAVVSLDAYPETKIKAIIEHIYYESKTVNNVTIYEVDLATEEMPLFFRSGMNASVDFIQQSRENALLIPLEAVHKEKNEDYVFVGQAAGKEPVRRIVELGIADEKNAEVLFGINEDDVIVLKTKRYSLPRNTTGTNPFMPARRR